MNDQKQTQTIQNTSHQALVFPSGSIVERRQHDGDMPFNEMTDQEKVSVRRRRVGQWEECLSQPNCGQLYIQVDVRSRETRSSTL